MLLKYTNRGGFSLHNILAISYSYLPHSLLNSPEICFAFFRFLDRVNTRKQGGELSLRQPGLLFFEVDTKKVWEGGIGG